MDETPQGVNASTPQFQVAFIQCKEQNGKLFQFLKQRHFHAVVH